MNSYRRLSTGLIILLFGLIQPAVFAQNKRIDSLKLTLNRKMPDTTRANTYYDIANAFYKQSQPDSALHYLKPMQQLCIRRNYLIGLGNYNRLNGVIYMHLGQFENALAFDQAAITQFTKANAPALVAKVYHNMGWLYKAMGESQHVQAYTRQGLVCIQRSIAINQQLKALSALCSNYINLGILYEDLGEYKVGRECFLKALTVADPIPPALDDARIIYNNLGKNYNVEGQFEQAIHYLNKSLAINLQLNRISSLVHNYRNLATSYAGLKQLDKAQKNAEKALALVKQAKDAPLASSVYKVLASTYASSGQYDKAYASVIEHKRIEDSLMNLAKTRAIAQLQGQYSVQQANALATIKANLDLAKAREIAKIEAEKTKEIASIQAAESRRIAQIRAKADIEKTRAVAELQTKYDTQKRVQQIAELDHRNQQRSQQIQYMGGGLAILVILLSLLIRQYYTIRQTNGRLQVQNEIITANSQQLVNQSNQLRTLMKELHHRVKNNLAIVSSLLNLQVSGLQDEKAIQAVRVGQQRVEAMALIHQRLYLTDRVTTINIHQYLADLAESLMQAYGYAPDDFDLTIDAIDQELDVDVAIPLGLIANELITNAFKYAYAGGQRPWLRIGLHNNNGFTLEVQDNGPGIDLADWQQLGRRASFGKRLIASLSEQLEGQFELLRQNGTLFRLHIPETRLQAA